MESLTRPSPALVVSIVALIVAITGVGVAAIPNKTTGAITGCFNSKSGVLRVIDEKRKCRRGEKRIVWSQTGKAGTTGPQGVQGTPGQQGPPGSDAQFNGAAADGDLDGTYPNPEIEANAVGAPEVGPNALGGDDIDENALVGINAATLGGSAPSVFAAGGAEHDAAYVNEGQANSVTTSMIPDGTVTEQKVTDTLHDIPLPISSFTDCDSSAGGFIPFTDNTAVDNAVPHFITNTADFLRIHFDAVDPPAAATDPDEDYAVCSSFMVPRDYVSGATVRVRRRKQIDSTAVPANAETLKCRLSENGASGQEGTLLLSGADGSGSQVNSCTVGSAALGAGDAVGLSIQITSGGTMDNPVEILGVAFRYTATSS